MSADADRDTLAGVSGDGSGMTRRRLLQGALAAPVAGGVAAAAAARETAAPAPSPSPSPSSRASSLHVAVVGAGAFGGWTALHLRRRGARVTLLDAWGPGNSRATSGGETRVIRGLYGRDRIYVDWVVKAFAQWRDHQRVVGQ